MINTQVINPYLTTATTGTPSNTSAETAPQPPVAQAPADIAMAGASTSAEQAATLGLGTRAGVALMAGITLLGAGVMAPSTAEARPSSHVSQGQFIPARHSGHHGHHGGWGGHHRGGAGGAIVGGIIGGIIGGAIMNGGGYYPAPPPVYSPGYNAYGCDGVFHHFDPNGNVSDSSGYYRLQQDQWGNCYRSY